MMMVGGGPGGAVDFGSNVGPGASSTSGGGGGSRRLRDTHAADRSAESMFLQHPGRVNRRERRGTAPKKKAEDSDESGIIYQN